MLWYYLSQSVYWVSVSRLNTTWWWLALTLWVLYFWLRRCTTNILWRYLSQSGYWVKGSRLTTSWCRAVTVWVLYLWLRSYTTIILLIYLFKSGYWVNYCPRPKTWWHLLSLCEFYIYDSVGALPKCYGVTFTVRLLGQCVKTYTAWWCGALPVLWVLYCWLRRCTMMMLWCTWCTWWLTMVHFMMILITVWCLVYSTHRQVWLKSTNWAISRATISVATIHNRLNTYCSIVMQKRAVIWILPCNT